MNVNGLQSAGRTGTTNFTAYISPYLVVNNGGNYTKHIYMGGQRITSKVSNSGIFATSPVITTDLQAKYTVQTTKIKERFDSLGVMYKGTPQSGGLVSSNPVATASSYFYHSDHLGSSSLITDQSGAIVQHLEYVPFGDTFIDERRSTSSWTTPYLFSGKERDEETGLLYFGARYQDSKYGIWYSVDPLAEKYPNVSSYVYCLNNPVKFIDPDGRDLVYFNSGGNEVRRVASSTQFKTYVDVKGNFAEAAMPNVIKGFESTIYQKYDYNIAAQTFIFNSLSEKDLPNTSSGRSLTGKRPSDLDPTLVKSIILEETGAGTINGKYGQNGKSDIMQANVTTTSGQTDWSDSKVAFGLQKGESANPNQSIYAGIRILFTKGLLSQTLKNKDGKTTGFSVTWRGENWNSAVKRYNGGGNPDYLEEVLNYFHSAIAPTPNNYVVPPKPIKKD